MNRREVAVTAAFAGLVMGMIVAFAGCSYGPDDEKLITQYPKVCVPQ